MVSKKPFLAGVIEGFYGREWSESARVAYAHYLSLCGLNTYLYAPKADSVLRRRWRERWPTSTRRSLDNVGKAYRDAGLFWGVGLSPLELYRDSSERERGALRVKIEYLGELEAPLMALLFDDMPGEIDSLAARQAEIVHDVVEWLPETRLLVCPTYYSFDPVLEKVFGNREANYWAELGRLLPHQVEVFWTGNQVCSTQISADDIAAITQQLGRPVTLWDNYPVNDSATRCQYLYTVALGGRRGLTDEVVAGHLCNPMNQARLSLPALTGLASLYDTGALDDDMLSAVMGQPFWERFKRDAQRFGEDGLEGMGAELRANLVEAYAQFDCEAAREVVGWLRGEYAFGPACLTD